MLIQECQVSDAELLLKLFHRLDHESTFLLFEPGERPSDVAAQKDILERFGASEKDLMLGAFQDEQIIGFCLLKSETWTRNRHRAALVMGVSAAYGGKGVGSALLKHILQHAEESGLRRIELTTRVDNLKAIALYQKFGFEIEGERRKALWISGQWISEYFMAKLS